MEAASQRLAAARSGVSSKTIAKVILVAALVMAALWFLYLIRRVIGEVFIAIFLAVALGPAVNFIQRRVRLGRGLAIVVVYLLLLLAVFGLGALVVPPIVKQINEFVSQVPNYIDDLRNNGTIADYDTKYHIVEKLRERAQALPGELGTAAGALQSVTVGVFSGIVQLVTVLVMTFFLLLDGRRIVNWIEHELGSQRGGRAREIADDMYRSVAGYVVGNLTISLIAGFTTWLVLVILGVDFAVPLAVLMAFLDLIPLVGSTIAGLLIALATVAFGDFPTDFIIWAVWVFVYQQVENNVLQPIVYRRTVALHPLLVLVAVLVGASLIGVLGALLAIPVAAAVQILVKDWWKVRRLRRETALATPDDPSLQPAGG